MPPTWRSTEGIRDLANAPRQTSPWRIKIGRDAPSRIVVRPPDAFKLPRYAVTVGKTSPITPGRSIRSQWTWPALNRPLSPITHRVYMSIHYIGLLINTQDILKYLWKFILKVPEWQILWPYVQMSHQSLLVKCILNAHFSIYSNKLYENASLQSWKKNLLWKDRFAIAQNLLYLL